MVEILEKIENCLIPTKATLDFLIDEVIVELQELENQNCNDCKHLENREELLKHSCLIEVCRVCSRNNNDNWELKQ